MPEWQVKHNLGGACGSSGAASRTLSPPRARVKTNAMTLLRLRCWWREKTLLAAAYTLAVWLTAAAEPVLWRLGTPDNQNAEFALAPGQYAQFRDDGFFVIGPSDAKADWPYVHPGPGDGWAGSRPHTFTILFGLKTAPAAGSCRLRLDLLDTHSSSPPRLRVEINGRRFEKDLPRGAGDASVFGDPAKGREFIWDLEFPADALRAGDNEVAIMTLSGSWLLYDAVQLETPAGAELTGVSSGTRLVGVRIPPVWVKEGDRAVQPLSLAIRHVGEPVDATVQLGGTEALRLRLKNGLHTVELKAPPAETSRQADLSVFVKGQKVARTNVTLAPPRVREMWILPHSHVDIGYTHRQEEIIRIQINNLERGMQLARASAGNPPGQRFKWNPEAVWVLDHFLQRASPEQRDAFLEAVRRGDVGVDGLYGNMLTGLCRPEELAQCLAFGARLSNLTGVPVESASICDVPGWTWGLVSMLADAGVKYFAIGPNHGDRVGTIHLWDNRPFYWKSPSGQQRVLCWVVDNYHFLGDLEHHILAQTEKLDRIGFPYDTSFMFWVGTWPGGGVDNAPPDERTVEKVVAWNAQYAAPRVVLGLASEYFRAFEQRHGVKVPEFSGDLTPYWEDGAGSTSRETALNRASADRLSQAETLFAMLDPQGSPGAAFDSAWKNVLLYSEHTWGAWNSISDPDNPFVTDQWKVKQAFALEADRESGGLLAKALGAGRSRTPTKTSNPKGNQAIASLDVFNTTQWARTDLAVVPPALAEARAGGVTDARGRAVPAQRLASGEWVFLAEDVPAFGAKRYHLVAQAKPTKGRAHVTQTGRTQLRTRNLTVELDAARGHIRSLRLAGLDQEFVDPHAPVGLNDHRYVLGTDAAGAQPNDAVRLTVIEPGPLVATVRLESDAPGCNHLVREVRVIDGLDRVELVNHVDRKAVRKKDGVHFGFGFGVPGGGIHLETPWAVVRPNIDQLPGACRNWFTVQRWVDVSNDDCGITWAPLDAPLMQIGGITANLLGSVAFHEWMTNAFDSQTIYSWAQNNHWHTNYKIDQPGVTTFRYWLRPHRRGYSGPDAARFGMESSRPLLVARADPQSSPPTSRLTVSSPDVLVETLKPSHDGRALLVRLFGVSGKTESVILTWSDAAPTSVWLTDLTEKPLRRIERRVEVPAYAVVHLRAELP